MVTPVWVSDEESLQEILKRTIRREDRQICLTECPEYANTLARQKYPCVFVERHKNDIGVFGVDLIFTADGEVTEPEQDLLEKAWQRHYHIPWQIVRTERLLIRESVMADLPEFVKMYEEERGNPDVIPMTGTPEEELASYIGWRYPLWGYGLWSVVELATGQVIGRVGFQEYECRSSEDTVLVRTELAYLVAGAYRRQGFAREAVQAVMEYAEEELGLTEVYLRTSEENVPSRRFAEEMGFKKISKIEYRNDRRRRT